MSSEVIVAVVSGVVGVTGGIISWIQAVRTSRLRAETDSTIETIRSEASLAVETMKAENERRRKAFEIASQESRPIETALAQAWHDIQTVKDVISKIVRPSCLDKDSVLKPLGSASSRLFEG